LKVYEVTELDSGTVAENWLPTRNVGQCPTWWSPCQT